MCVMLCMRNNYGKTQVSSFSSCDVALHLIV